MRFSFLFLFLLCISPSGHARTWTDATGKFKIDADFVELTEGKLVQLKLSNGEIRTIPLSKLSEDDRKHVASLIETEMETSPFSAGPSGVAAKPESLPKILPPQSSSNETASVMEVIAAGVGLTQEAAQKDAYRNAVRQVVGLYVDSQTLVENDELIEDKVLTASNGVVRTAKTIPSSVTEENGLWRLRARVTVEVTEVTSRLAEAKVIKQKIDGESMFAKAMSKMEKKQSTEELLKELFAELPNMVKLSLQGAPDYDTNTGELIYTVELTPDIEAYREFLPRLTKALETVAVKRLPESIVRPMPSGEIRNGYIEDVEGVLGFWLGKKDPRTSPGEGIVTVLSFWNRKHTSQKWNSYVVDLGVLKEKNINKYRPSNHWLHSMSRSYANQQNPGHDLAMNVDVTFFSKEGDPIDTDRWTWDCDYYPEYNPTSGRELLSGSPNLMISRICQYRTDSISYDYWYPNRNNNFSVIIAPLCMAIGSDNSEKYNPFLFRLNSKKTRRIKFNSEQLKDLADVQISFRTQARELN
jgi:hypothetical protein